jgi:hypothetical protein
MFSILPVLHENQTLYSWCGLTHALSGSTNAHVTSTRLFGAPYAALSHDFPSRLIALDRSTQGALGRLNDIALRNTLLGYYLAVVRQAQAEQIIGLLRTGTIRHLKMLLGITASRVGGHHPLKGCQECFKEDETSHGWAYWHVDHQIPSVFVCTKHHRPLAIAWDPVTPVHRRYWLLPRDPQHFSWTEISVPSDCAMTCLLRLATDSEYLMKLPPASLEPNLLTAGYQRIMQEVGLATKKGNLRTGRLVSLVKERYRGLEDLPGLAPLRAIDDQWPGLAASMSRRVSRPGHPLKHLLLIGTISDSWSQFLLACEPKIGAFDSEQTSHAGNIDAADRLANFREMITVQNLSVRAASLALGVTTTTGTQWAKRLNISYTPRTKYLFPKTIAMVCRLLKNGDSVSDIALVSGVSTTTVNRVLGANPAIAKKRAEGKFCDQQSTARHNFSKLCRAYSDRPLSTIRTKPANSYMWLYRNDHKWLKAKLAEQGRISSRSR